MHILITGGSGFLGSALTERLRREGADVTWLSRRASPFIWGVWHDAAYLAGEIAAKR